MKSLLPRRTKEGDYLELQMEDGQIVRAKLIKKPRTYPTKLDRLLRGEHLDHEDDEI